MNWREYNSAFVLLFFLSKQQWLVKNQPKIYDTDLVKVIVWFARITVPGDKTT